MRGVGLVLAITVLAAACSSSDGSDGAEVVVTVDSTVSPPDDFALDETKADGAATTLPAFVDGPLADVCPEVISVQTAGLPGVVVGPLHALLGDAAEFDEARQSLVGPLVRPDGTVEDVRLELRSGGPAVGFRSPAKLIDADDTLLLAQVSTADVVRLSDSISLTGIATLTDATHQVIVIDPGTFPDVTDFADLRKAAVEIRHVTDSPVIDFLINTGEVDAAQTVPGFTGEPASFVAAEGAIAQLGDLLVDPALLQSLPQWARPIATLSPRSVGWQGHDDMIVARAEDLATNRECFGRLVPVIQSAIVAYTFDAAPTNVAMSAARELANPLTRITAALMDEGVVAGLEAGVFSNGANGTVGDFDLDTLQSFVSELFAQADVDPVPLDELVTNDFIDPTVGL